MIRLRKDDGDRHDRARLIVDPRHADFFSKQCWSHFNCPLSFVHRHLQKPAKDQ
jgi:hypothetical protein